MTSAVATAETAGASQGVHHGLGGGGLERLAHGGAEAGGAG